MQIEATPLTPGLVIAAKAPNLQRYGLLVMRSLAETSGGDALLLFLSRMPDPAWLFPSSTTPPPPKTPG